MSRRVSIVDSNVQVVVISANQQGDIVNRTRVGGARFLPKPLTEEMVGDFLTPAGPRQAVG
jgi:hypothetical protein